MATRKNSTVDYLDLDTLGKRLDQIEFLRTRRNPNSNLAKERMAEYKMLLSWEINPLEEIYCNGMGTRFNHRDGCRLFGLG